MADSKSLNLFPIDYPFETLVSRYKTKKLILDPEFQRKYKWDKDGYERSSKFIESTLMRIPLPACYFAENDKREQIVIDGVQRITTIAKFFNDEFALEGLTVFKELEGKKFSELGDIRGDLETSTIRCIVLRKENPRGLIKEIFARLNQGAVQLTAQEIRHAIFPGNLNNLLIELSKIPFIANFGNGVSGQKEKDGREAEEMILRFFSMQTDLSDYEDKLSKYLDAYIEKNQNAKKAQIDILRKDFNDTFEKCMLVFNNKPFVDVTKTKERQSLVYYDLLMWSFRTMTLPYVKKNKTKIAKKFNELCQDTAFNKTLSGGLQQKSSIIRRRNIWMAKLETINGKHNS